MRAAIFVLLFIAAACAPKPPAGVSPAEADQIELVARVKTALLNDAIVGTRRIDVQASQGDIRLTGRVASTAERDRAVAIARSVSGVRTVTSDLVIQP